MFLDQDAFYITDKNGYEDIIKKESKRPITFSDKVQKSYENKKTSFVYNNKTFYLKINKEEPELIYICDESEVLGEFYTDGTGEFIIELDPNKKNKIFGFKPSKPIRINLEKNDFQK